MNWISTQFARHWRNIHYGAVVVLSLAIVFFPTQANRFLGQGVVGVFYYPFARIQTALRVLTATQQNVDELTAQLTKEGLKVSQMEEAVRENERLRRTLGFEPPSGYRLMPAEVISVSGYRLPVTAIINRGVNDSVYVNQPVINQQGLIGRITAAAADFATVQLLTDPANRVAARVESSREMGIVRYVSGSSMILDNFPVHGSIAVGDTIISSGLGGVYPPGLRVGVVTGVKREEHAPFARVELEPVANFHSIEELFLLRPDDRR